MLLSLLEIAIRALLVAAAVGVGMYLLRVRDVLAQKAAWGLVLASALLMPLLLPLAQRLRILPVSIAVPSPARSLGLAASSLQEADAVLPQTSPQYSLTAPSARPQAMSSPLQSANPARVMPRLSDPGAAAPMSASPRSTIQTAPPMDRSVQDRPVPLRLHLMPLLGAIYLAVCGVLLVRLIFGLTSAIGLWLDAEPIELDAASQGLRLRISRAVASPVTIGSGVVLPYNYDEWDQEKLRIVLAHERSHVRQGDFYLQLLAGVYSTVFWFSPLGWWLKRKLSDLGEAISDRAGLEQAASRSSYAQLLLEFAAAPRPTLFGVAMARTCSLANRIERLLNESIFRQAFSGSRRRALLVGVFVPVAFFAAALLLRVEAATVKAPQPDHLFAQAPATTGQSNPDQAQDSVAPAAPDSQAPASPSAPEAAAPAVPPTAPNVLAPVSPGPPPGALIGPTPGALTGITVGPGQTLTINRDGTQIMNLALAKSLALANAARGRALANSYAARGRAFALRDSMGKGFAYAFSTDDDESYALVTGPASSVRFSGDWMDGRKQEIEKASKIAHGKFLWFEHDDKSYVIDDPAIIASIEEMYKPIDELGRKQEELGKQQEELGRQQEELGRKQEQASAPAPDVSAEIAKIEAALAKLKAKQGQNITQDQLGDLQEQIGELQGKIGDIEGKIGEEQGRLGEQQGKLGEKQGELGEEQGRLGEQQGRLAEEADRKVKVIISDSLKNGKARPVE